MAPHSWREQDALFIGAFDDFCRGHLWGFCHDLEQSDKEGVEDECLLLCHHFLADLNFAGREDANKRLAIRAHATNDATAGTHIVVPQSIIRDEQDRIGSTMALLEEGRFLGVQRLERRQHHHRGATAIRLAGRLDVAAHRQREGVVAAFADQGLVVKTDVEAGELLAFGIAPVGLIIRAQTDMMEEVELFFRLCSKRRLAPLEQPGVPRFGISQLRLPPIKPEPANETVYQPLVIFLNKEFTHRHPAIAKATLRTIRCKKLVKIHTSSTISTERMKDHLVLRTEVRVGRVAELE